MYSILIAVILIRTCSDICIKKAVHKTELSNVSNLKNTVPVIIKNPFLWLGIILGALNVVCWFTSLRTFDLSFAYPFLSISYVTIILAGKVIFKEHLDTYKIVGISLISVGVLTLFIT